MWEEGVTVVTMYLILELSCYTDTFKRNRFITQFSASNFLKLASTVQYNFFFSLPGKGCKASFWSQLAVEKWSIYGHLYISVVRLFRMMVGPRLNHIPKVKGGSFERMKVCR